MEQDAITVSDAVEPHTGSITKAIEGLAQLASGALTPRQLAVGVARLQAAYDALENILKNLKAKITALVLTEGTQVTEKGSRQLRVDGAGVLTIRPHRTGLDPKKVEALLRAKGKSPGDFMDAVVAYKVNEGKLKKAELNADEIKLCEFDLTWAVMKPEVG